MSTSVSFSNSSIPEEIMAASNFTDQKCSWLLELKEIEPGHSAILGGNTLVFYGVHYTGILSILISLISCTAVLISVCRNSKKRENWDFSDRFPLCLALSDFLWGIVNISTDHLNLVIRQVYPEKSVAEMLAISVFLFFGYQQLMSSGLSLFTYLKVVRRISLDLGRWEWKLHATVVSFLCSLVALYIYFEALGNAGFWFLADMNTTWGKLLAVNICTTCTVHALLTLMAYRSIQNVIKNQKRVVSMHIPPLSASYGTDWSEYEEIEKESKNKTVSKSPCKLTQSGYHTTATNCLTTFVYISLCLYLPFAVTAWVYAIIGMFGYIEPTTAFLIVIQANSGGWVNAWGYFHNRKLKQGRRNALMNQSTAHNPCSTSTS